MNVNFDALVENCETIGDLQKIVDEAEQFERDFMKKAEESHGRT